MKIINKKNYQVDIQECSLLSGIFDKLQCIGPPDQRKNTTYIMMKDTSQKLMAGINAGYLNCISFYLVKKAS